MIHCWAERPAFSSRPMVGSAMLTTLPSTKVIEDPMIVAIRVRRRLAARAGSTGAAWGAALIGRCARLEPLAAEGSLCDHIRDGRHLRSARRDLPLRERGI